MKIRILCMCFFLTWMMAFSVSAKSIIIDDQAELLSDRQETLLEDIASRIAEAGMTDVMFLTTNDAMGMTARDYADSFLDNYMTSDDGIAMLIDMDNRTLQIETAGKMIDILYDSRLNACLDNAFVFVSAQDYYGVFLSMGNDILSYIDQGGGAYFNYNSDTGETTVSNYFLDQLNQDQLLDLKERIEERLEMEDIEEETAA